MQNKGFATIIGGESQFGRVVFIRSIEGYASPAFGIHGIAGIGFNFLWQWRSRSAAASRAASRCNGASAGRG